MNLISRIESILFVASAPLAVKKIAKALGVEAEKVTDAIGILRHKYSGDDSGVHLIEAAESVQLVTNPAYRDLVEQFTKSELIGELTKAQLETLTVIAYRGLITRPELEQIRGVNCAVILRNLLLRGLIEEHERVETLGSVYAVSLDTLRFLGIPDVKQLPDYATLHAHEHIERVLEGGD